MCLWIKWEIQEPYELLLDIMFPKQIQHTDQTILQRAILKTQSMLI